MLRFFKHEGLSAWSYCTVSTSRSCTARVLRPSNNKTRNAFVLLMLTSMHLFKTMARTVQCHCSSVLSRTCYCTYLRHQPLYPRHQLSPSFPPPHSLTSVSPAAPPRLEKTSDSWNAVLCVATDSVRRNVYAWPVAACLSSDSGTRVLRSRTHCSNDVLLYCTVLGRWDWCFARGASAHVLCTCGVQYPLVSCRYKSKTWGLHRVLINIIYHIVAERLQRAFVSADLQCGLRLLRCSQVGEGRIKATRSAFH